MSSLHLGGAETALLGLLENMDYDKYDVDLFLYRHEGELLPYLPKQVRLLPENAVYACLAEGWFRSLRRGYLRIALQRVLAIFQARWKFPGVSQASINGDYLHKHLLRFLPPIAPDRKYDLAVSFIFPHYIVADKVQATKKVAWIHTDYTSVKLDIASQLRMWGKYDNIISISEAVSRTFCEIFPTLGNRLIIIENILPEAYIKKRADEEIPNWQISTRTPEIKLLSVGRFSPQKNFDNVPDICRHVLQFGVAIKWYLIGYGGDEKLIRQKITEAGMQDKVVVLGKKDNPYPYIKDCDVYVQPSRYEGKSVAVREAQLLGKPVIITAFPTAGSQLQDGVDGLIVPLDNEKCAQCIALLLKNSQILQKITHNCRTNDFSLKSEILKFNQLLEEK